MNSTPIAASSANQDKSPSQLFREEVVALFEKRKIKGVIAILELPQVHYSNIGLGTGEALDVLNGIRQNLIAQLTKADGPTR